MTTASAKAKGRRLQQLICKDLYNVLFKDRGLHADDCKSCGMGQNGLDCVLSPAARSVLDLAIECKNRETLNVSTLFNEHYARYKDTAALKLLIHKRNLSDVLVTMRWNDLLPLLKSSLLSQHD